MSDKMNRLGVDCNVIYVDAEIATSGDGVTPATALKTIPLMDQCVKETVYFCRKTLPSNIVCKLKSGGECYFISMPKKEMDLYKTIPESVKTVWDKDEFLTMAFTVDASNGSVTFGPIK
jgi:hypothetical protein